MSNPQKVKGDRWERDVLAVFGAAGVDGYRLKAGGERDRGDLCIAGWAVQCKDQARWSVPEWWRGTLAQADAADAAPMLVIKRPRCAPEDGLAVVDLATMAALIGGGAR